MQSIVWLLCVALVFGCGNSSNKGNNGGPILDKDVVASSCRLENALALAIGTDNLLSVLLLHLSNVVFHGCAQS